MVTIDTTIMRMLLVSAIIVIPTISLVAYILLKPKQLPKYPQPTHDDYNTHVTRSLLEQFTPKSIK